MIGLVVVTHGRLAEEFVLAMEHVVGPQSGVRAICIGPEDDMERRRRDILKACAVDRGGQWHLDVRAGVHAQLLREGAHVSSIVRCTATDPHLFSYRASGRTGRQGMIVAL